MVMNAQGHFHAAVATSPTIRHSVENVDHTILAKHVYIAEKDRNLYVITVANQVTRLCVAGSTHQKNGSL